MFGNGYYFVDVFDLFGATFPLLLVALFECLAILFYAGKLKDRTSGDYKELFTAGIKKYKLLLFPRDFFIVTNGRSSLISHGIGFTSV